MPKPKTKTKAKAKTAAQPKAADKKAPVRKLLKKQAGTAAYEKRLLEMREDLMNLVQHKQEVDLTEQEVGDEADVASHSTEKELLFELSDNERQTLDSVEAALRKIETGTYGKCEGCGKTIPAPRLKAIPHARYCVNCQARFEIPRG